MRSPFSSYRSWLVRQSWPAPSHTGYTLCFRGRTPLRPQTTRMARKQTTTTTRTPTTRSCHRIPLFQHRQHAALDAGAGNPHLRAPRLPHLAQEGPGDERAQKVPKDGPDRREESDVLVRVDHLRKRPGQFAKPEELGVQFPAN